jgi:hypothetical protein
MHDAVRRRTARRRPTPVTILTAVQVISSTGAVLSALAIAGAQFAVLERLIDPGAGYTSDDALVSVVTTGALMVMGILGYAAAILLFRMRQLGWTLTMLLAGVSLASQIYLYVVTGELTVHLMLVQVVIVLYLNQREVRAAFAIGASSDGADPELDERG